MLHFTLLLAGLITDRSTICSNVMPNEITEELHRNFAEIAPRALNILTDLAENAESESVRLGATPRSFG